MGLDRRTFLKKAGLGLAALGVSETVFSLLGDNSLAVPVVDDFVQALTQPGGRKLALLVGINQYPSTTALGGCVTDVELQRELLIHRFGFNPSDILTLTDSQASRENIETAFVEHLSEQAKTGDIVVFHFSGYGSRVKLTQESQTDNSGHWSNSLVPVDGIIPTKGAPIANDLLEETLLWLLRSLATDRVTTVLDTSYIEAARILQGNLKVRSCPNPPAEAPSPEELAFQEQIRLRTTSLWEKLTKSESPNQIPGVILTAAQPNQLATEGLWNGFSAGLFTYALTQYLWQATPPTTVQISLSRAAGMVNQVAGQEQQPRLMNQKSLQQSLLAYYLPLDSSVAADGVITAVEDTATDAQVWLAGLPATVLEYYGINSLLSLLPSTAAKQELNEVESLKDNLPLENASSEQPASLQPTTSSNLPLGFSSGEQPSTPKNLQLQLRSKEGLRAKARIFGNSTADKNQLQVGQQVQEAVRVLSRNVGLTIALDANLERIERVDATSAFAAIPSVTSVVTAGEQPADYVFGKVQYKARDKAQETTAESTSSVASRPSPDSQGGYGLFYLARDPIHNTTGTAGEAVKSAVNRLNSKLQTLLAAKLLRLTANEGSSRLGIRASLEMVAPETKVVMQRKTVRGSSTSQDLAENKTSNDGISGVAQGSISTLPIGSRIQYRLENYSDANIYFMLLGLDSNGSAIALYEIQSLQDTQGLENKSSVQNAVIAPGETLTIPYSSAASTVVVSGPVGLTEIQLICSRSPLKNAIQALEAARHSKEDGLQFGNLSNPLDVARAVLLDLHEASAIASASIGTTSDTYALDVNAWATLSFIYQIV